MHNVHIVSNKGAAAHRLVMLTGRRLSPSSSPHLPTTAHSSPWLHSFTSNNALIYHAIQSKWRTNAVKWNTFQSRKDLPSLYINVFKRPFSECQCGRDVDPALGTSRTHREHLGEVSNIAFTFLRNCVIYFLFWPELLLHTLFHYRPILTDLTVAIVKQQKKKKRSVTN